MTKVNVYHDDYNNVSIIYYNIECILREVSVAMGDSSILGSGKCYSLSNVWQEESCSPQIVFLKLKLGSSIKHIQKKKINLDFLQWGNAMQPLHTVASKAMGSCSQKKCQVEKFISSVYMEK